MLKAKQIMTIKYLKFRKSIIIIIPYFFFYDADSFPYQKVLKEFNKRTRGKNIVFKLPEFFDNFNIRK